MCSKLRQRRFEVSRGIVLVRAVLQIVQDKLGSVDSGRTSLRGVWQSNKESIRGMIHYRVHKVICSLSSSLSRAKDDSIIWAHLYCIIIVTNTFQDNGPSRIDCHIFNNGLLKFPNMINVLLAHHTAMVGRYTGNRSWLSHSNSQPQSHHESFGRLELAPIGQSWGKPKNSARKDPRHRSIISKRLVDELPLDKCAVTAVRPDNFLCGFHTLQDLDGRFLGTNNIGCSTFIG
mmetsp:Transcript_9932/g.17854  ORF Transcript_9932/g.17854 Transcript_9932/m.17854 type:complete len:232 (-) Transcript_9932:586-1281(-)